MKNFVLLGSLWKRAVEFVNEAQADQYIAQRCQGIDYEKCSAAEVDSRFAGLQKKYLSYDQNQHPIRGLIVVQGA
ncbi:hypothetical protein [uncultured Thiothrix sp.]|uniref:hypothetical protein n=1 Tax=uncultured Thiothrix sp. TaxID=223185 RepID=UPI0026308645|nr:hypothetical protein [uncultured Thiothrix sp.]